jgi:hypothetical protein
MYNLSEEQIDYILSDIRRNGVDMENLQLNLLDHICCIIEQELKENDDFEHFYHKTIKQFYKKELREIEEETINLLTFKNYYAMKKAMIWSGAFSAMAFIIGSLFKIMHWPGAAILLVLGITAFSLVFLPMVLMLKTKEAGTTRNKVVITVGILVGIMYCLSTMFLVQHWPGARIMWFSTLLLSFFVLIPIYFFTGIRKPETKMNVIVTTIIMLGVLGTQFTITAIRPPTDTQGKAYTYLQSEELLHNAMAKYPATDQTTISIQKTCELLKQFILKQDIGMSPIPPNFEDAGITIRERHVNSIVGEGEGKQLLQRLRNEVDKYNADNAVKIPVVHTILEPGFTEKQFCSSLFAVTNITQLQLFLANTGSNKIAIAP